MKSSAEPQPAETNTVDALGLDFGASTAHHCVATQRSSREHEGVLRVVSAAYVENTALHEQLGAQERAALETQGKLEVEQAKTWQAIRLYSEAARQAQQESGQRLEGEGRQRIPRQASQSNAIAQMPGEARGCFREAMQNTDTSEASGSNISRASARQSTVPNESPAAVGNREGSRVPDSRFLLCESSFLSRVTVDRLPSDPDASASSFATCPESSLSGWAHIKEPLSGR